MSDYYELLQVPRNADDAAIKKAYRQLARRYHPDSNKSQIAAEHMKLLNAAYDTLSDPLKRRQYDERLEAGLRHGVPHDAFDQYAYAAPPRASVARPWLVWIGMTALLILAALIGTLFALRNQLPSLVLLVMATPTHTLASAATATRTPTPTYTTTAVPSPMATASATPSPTATRLPPTATPSSTPTATPLPPTPRPPTPVSVQPYPLPSSVPSLIRLVTAEFQNDASGPSDIFVSQLDGGNKINLTRSESRNEQSPSWSPQGQNIVFTEFNSGSLYLTNAEGSELTQLTSDPVMRDSNPVWSPTGSLIAFSSIARNDFINGLTDKAKVFVVDVNTRQRRLIADRPARDLTWSPDGRWLAYQVPSANGATLYVSSAEGNFQPFFAIGGRIRRIAWTRDSRQVAYETFVREQSEVYVMTLQPFNLQRLSGSIVVVSPRGAFPGPALAGESYPPIISSVRQ